MSIRTNSRARISRGSIAFITAALLALVVLAGSASAAGLKGKTTLALDPGAGAALTSLGVSVAPVAPATADSDGISFPITGLGGSLFPPGLKINHSGGLALSAGSTTVSLTDYSIVLDRSPDLVATVNGGPRVSILKLDLSRARIGLGRSGLTVGPVKASLTEAAAGALNGAFGVTAFTKGLVLGSATIKVGR
jgi:hypothetical protein